MKRISVAHRFKDRALVTAVVPGIAFSLITLLFIQRSLSSRDSCGAFTLVSH